ncbi:MAG: ATP-binding cassette domain-containing protein [Thermoplasmatota archaeon]
MDTFLKIEDLNKTFNGFELSNINLNIKKGEVVLLAGRNGAGKTKLLESISCISPPTSGHIQFFNETVFKNKTYKKNLHNNLNKVGLMLQDERLFSSLTVEEIFETFSSLYDVDDYKKYFAECELIKESIHKRINELSEGKKQLTKFLLSISHDPDLVILDEPNSYLDDEVRKWLFNKINEMKKHGTSFLISSNQMWEVGGICDELIILENGKIIDTISEFKKYYNGSVIEVPKKTMELNSIPGQITIKEKENRKVIFTTHHIKDVLDKIELEEEDIIEIRKLRLEDFYNLKIEVST